MLELQNHRDSDQILSPESLFACESNYYYWYSGFQVTAMIEWVQKSKSQKMPGPKFNLEQIPCRNFQAINIPWRLDTNIKIPIKKKNKILAKLSVPPKDPEIENFNSPQKNPSLNLQG